MYLITSKSFFIDIFLSHINSDRVAVLASSAGVDSNSGSAGGTPFTKAKGLWQVTQKQKMVDDLVNKCCTSNNDYFLILVWLLERLMRPYLNSIFGGMKL